jgi:transcriptional regulator with XRE-family HTH domain
MSYSIQPLIDALRTTRERKMLSQRALAALIGIPQGRLSRIEGGATDLRASSLLELARALEMEVMLVPRQLVPAVKSLTAQVEMPEDQQAAQRPAYRLDEEDDDDA